MKFILTYNHGKILNYIIHSPTFDTDPKSLMLQLSRPELEPLGSGSKLGNFLTLITPFPVCCKQAKTGLFHPPAPAIDCFANFAA